MAELATLMTAIVMTALKTDGSPDTPAYSIAKTKGEALVLAPELPRRSSEPLGTIIPTISSEII